MGVVGLGIGTLAAWGISGDVFRFYEIDPEVIDDAQQEFTVCVRRSQPPTIPDR